MNKMKSSGEKWFDRISTFFLWIITLVFIFPFYWVITGSIKNPNLVKKLPPQWFPTSISFASYQQLMKQPVWDWLYNSVFISVVALVITCIAASMAGYVLAKKNFYGKTVLFILIVGAMALPKQVVLIPLVQLISSLKMHDNAWAVILPASSWPFGIFLMKQFSETVPKEMLEAAKVDGCNELRTFVQIVLPIVKPGVAALAIFTFITTWNDYFLQLIMLNSRTKLTLQLGIATMNSEFGSNFGPLMAGATFAALPILIVFIAFQKYFTQGITMGAVKG